MRIVLDTNALVAGLLTPFGTCGEIVRMLMSGEITLCIDARILIEYQDVLRRPRFDFHPGLIAALMEYIEKSAESFPVIALPKPLPDPDDDPFLEVALSAKVESLVTGNLPHFPIRRRSGVPVLSPREFLEFFKERKTTG